MEGQEPFLNSHCIKGSLFRQIQALISIRQRGPKSPSAQALPGCRSWDPESRLPWPGWVRLTAEADSSPCTACPCGQPNSAQAVTRNDSSFPWSSDCHRILKHGFKPTSLTLVNGKIYALLPGECHLGKGCSYCFNGCSELTVLGEFVLHHWFGTKAMSWSLKKSKRELSFPFLYWVPNNSLLHLQNGMTPNTVISTAWITQRLKWSLI